MACPRARLLAALETLAPLRLAEPWDNVGLLIDGEERSHFTRALLTIELDDETLAEAIERRVDLVLAYHPPLFGGLKRLRVSSSHERVVVRALGAGLTVYSPHTALDAAPGGMASWLGEALGSGVARPLVALRDEPTLGAGRWVELDEAVEFEVALDKIKAHLGLTSLRVSRAPSGPASIRTLAVCPGAGGSLFEKCGSVDLLLTGEMRHHDVLSRRAQGTHVILTEHSNSERAYLPRLGRVLGELCPELEILVSERDADPLRSL